MKITIFNFFFYLIVIIKTRNYRVQVLWNGLAICNTSIPGPYSAIVQREIAKRLPTSPMIHCGEFYMDTCCWRNAVKSNVILNCYSFFAVNFYKIRINCNCFKTNLVNMNNHSISIYHLRWVFKLYAR